MTGEKGGGLLAMIGEKGGLLAMTGGQRGASCNDGKKEGLLNTMELFGSSKLGIIG